MAGNFLSEEAATFTQPFQESHSTFPFTSISLAQSQDNFALIQARKSCLLAKTGVLFFTKRDLVATGECGLCHGHVLVSGLLFASLSLILLRVPSNIKSLLIDFHKMPHFSPICSERSWLTALFVCRGVAQFGRPGPAALLLSRPCPASVFFLESKDKQQDFILLPFHSSHLFLVRI